MNMLGRTTSADRKFWMVSFVLFCVLGIISHIFFFCILIFLLKNTWSENYEKNFQNKTLLWSTVIASFQYHAF